MSSIFEKKHMRLATTPQVGTDQLKPLADAFISSCEDPDPKVSE